MNRKFLLWFAAGATASAVAAIATYSLFPKAEQPTAYLVIYEDMERMVDLNETQEVASLTGEMLRECGVESFDIVFPIVDGDGYSLVPINSENAGSFQCALKRSSRENFRLDVWLERNPDA